ncbi:tRNA pseudouridine(38-40) synthase TruA [Raineyella fluvialis]|uniref:tRNA pseudouridine synthase A n=1 Tax=Raineyella fluvialis TaxID=2662261 RepID=A0A5Q2F7S2_9ACTN|nr:tRNA pseudouridine(38-40) synthase TruA [Raineyella fluvialis]QGF22708.1 tRNA pseudouridine(38-40) synthase TruA [Raineyella fluvialis]
MPDTPAPATTRWRLDIAYDGASFSGWAAQPGRRTVQGELEHWIGQVLRLGSAATLTVAGRTDAGVHARGQVAHVDLPDDAPVDTLLRRLRRVLPADVVVRDVRPAPAGFDARFAAQWRRYVYRLADARSFADPLLRGHVARIRGTLDLAALDAAGRELLGLRDFAAFCKPREGATTIRTLLECSAARHDAAASDGTVEVTVRADAFCHSMVRSLIGALTAVATGQRDLDWLRGVRDATSRQSSILVMPAHGLTLEEVGYPADDELAARAERARAVRELPPPTTPTPDGDCGCA